MEGLKLIISMFDSVINNSIEKLSYTPDAYDSLLYDLATTINNNLMPIASFLLLLYFGLDFFNSAIEFKFKNIKTILPYIIKTIIGISVLQLNKDILMGIFAIGNKILEKISFTNTDLNINFTNFESDYNALGFFAKTSLNGMILLTMITVLIAILVIQFVVISRMIEIYMFIAFAPIAFCSFVNSTTSRIGKDYISNFATVVLKSSVITFVFLAYKYLVISFGILNYTGMYNFMFNMIFLSILIISLIVGSEAMSRKIIGSFR